jgi:hypothetical protein
MAAGVNKTGLLSGFGDPVLVGVDDSTGKIIKIIRDKPQSPDDVAAQRELCSRLSVPRPIYVRKDDLAELQAVRSRKNV